jgi:hypothetical protein
MDCYPTAAKHSPVPRPTVFFCFLIVVLAAGCDDGTDVEVADGGALETTMLGCGKRNSREIPRDLAARGPWSVGALNLTLVDGLNTEIWYPAVPGSEEGRKNVTYDLRDHIPNPSKVSDQENPIQICDCYRNLPLDTEYGPYPVIVFVHGAGGFLSQDMELMTHWASRGFVVLASDHPGIMFEDMVLGKMASYNPAGDVRKTLRALKNHEGASAFLEGQLKQDRIGAMGHSAGAVGVATLGNDVQVIIFHSGGGLVNPQPETAMYISGTVDFGYAMIQGMYQIGQPDKRALYLKGGGHLVGTSLCGLRDPRDPSRDLLDIVQEYRIGGPMADFAEILFQGCNEVANDSHGRYINEVVGIDIFRYATTGLFEDVLQCSPTAADDLRKIKTVFGDDIADYREVLHTL